MSTTKFREEVIKNLIKCEEIPQCEAEKIPGHILDDSKKKGHVVDVMQ